MGDALEKIGGSVMNLVLGALIVWVGQTTFQHAGILASVDQKFAAIDKQFQDDEKRHDSMRKWLENVVSDLKDSNRSQFTQKEGDQLIAQLRQVEGSAINLERKFADRLSELEVRLVALQESGQNTQEVAALAAEVTQLRFAISQGTAPPEVQYSTAQRVSQRPVYLPPVGSGR
jgi:predicted nuclease with TOPRIM domain